MWYTAPAQLLKAESKSDRLECVAVASDETLDEDKDNILSSAFTDEVRSKFLKLGHIDWDHLTIRGSVELEKAAAMIGTPTAFYEEKVKGKKSQIIEFYLHRGNPYVDDTVEPALRAKSDRIKCSIGGKILGYEPNAFFQTGSDGKAVGGRSMHQITMNHLAMTPAYKAINKNTSVRMANLAKAGELIQFAKSYDLCKSLEAGNLTDAATIVGAQALQAQSLDEQKVILDFHRESARYQFSKAAGKHVIYDILEDIIAPNERQIQERSVAYGMTNKQAITFAKLVIMKVMPKILAMKNNQRLLKTKLRRP